MNDRHSDLAGFPQAADLVILVNALVWRRWGRTYGAPWRRDYRRTCHHHLGAR